MFDTTFWLKPWLKLISFGSNFFHLVKVLATTNSEPGLALTMAFKETHYWDNGSGPYWYEDSECFFCLFLNN